MRDPKSTAKPLDMRAALKGMPLPAAVAGTRPAAGDEWRRDGERDPSHAQWELTDANGNRAVVSHDPVVDLGGVTLSHPARLCDGLTRRVVALCILNRATRRRFTLPELLRFLNALDWTTRFKLSINVEGNAHLVPGNLDDYVIRLKSPFVAALVPIVPRIEALCEREAEAARCGRRLDGSRWQPLNGVQVAAELGVTPDSLSPAVLQARLTAALRLEAAHVPDESREENGGEREEDEGNEDGRSLRSLRVYLEPWEILADLSARGLLPHDPLGFTPFDPNTRGTLKQVAASHGVVRFRAGISPPYFLKVLDAAVRWSDYSPQILRAVKAARDNPDLSGTRSGSPQKQRDRLDASEAFDDGTPAGMPRLFLSWLAPRGASAQQAAGRISLTAAVQHLMSAALILVASFAMQKVKKALELTTECLSGPEDGFYELSLHREKWIRDLDKMPVPGVVVQLIRALELLTEDTRAAHGGNGLYRYARDFVSKEGGQVFVGFPSKSWLREFLVVNRLPLRDPETLVSMTGDMLQVGAAMAYHHVTPALPIEALARALGQFDPNVTRALVERRLPGASARVSEMVRVREGASRLAGGQAQVAELHALLLDFTSRQEDFEAVRCDALTQLAMGIVRGTDMPGGAGGERIVDEIQGVFDDARRMVQLSGRNHPDALGETLLSGLARWARSRRADRASGGHTRCTCRHGHEGDLALARCLAKAREAVQLWDAPELWDAWPKDRPPSGFDDMVTCSLCPHNAAFAEDRRRQEAECGRVEDARERAGSEAQERACDARLAQIRAAAAASAPSGRNIT